jgi:hypothetical protein
MWTAGWRCGPRRRPVSRARWSAAMPPLLRPPYLGPRGWVGVNLDDPSQPDWAEVGGLLEQAWRMTAKKTAVAAYDATRAPPS